jgi:hypothetical protein
MGVNLYNHPLLPPTVPLVGVNGADVHSQSLAPVMEIVGTQVVCVETEVAEAKIG